MSGLPRSGDREVYHVPVMLREVREYLNVQPEGVYVDATLGGGGYAEAIFLASASVKVYGFDTDPHAMAFARKRLEVFGERLQIVPENFVEIRTALAERGVTQIDGIAYDLGISSHQIDTASIGLSYRVDAPLDMRLDPRLPRSAMDVIAESSEAELKDIFRKYGEEPHAGKIAWRIVQARLKRPIDSTTMLAEIVTTGVREDKKASVLSRIFQALRIEVNDELRHLEQSLEQSLELLKPGGRVVVVSYHSLEDRIVKDWIRREAAPRSEPGSMIALKENIDRSRARLKAITGKPVSPGDEEVERNPRARSARLRVAEKL
jgi:16S rRNA (cytosine1402-N4)-methyltransferase